MKVKICAGIVTYNPEIIRLEKNIKCISHQVEIVYIYDNGSSNVAEIKNTITKFNNCILILSKSNDGIAKALNVMTWRAEEEGFEWILTLDQDSVCAENMIANYSKYLQEQDVAILAPYAIDKRRLDSQYLIPKEDITDINYTFTSGSLVNIKICHSVGDYDEFLFVGLVDVDFCKRITLNRYRILRCNKVILDQEFGNITPSNHADFFLKLGSLLNNSKIKKLSYKREVSPFRVKYAVRNQIYLMKKYKNIVNIKTEFTRMMIGNIFTIFRGKKKLKIIQAIFGGIKEGLKSAPAIYIPIGGDKE